MSDKAQLILDGKTFEFPGGAICINEMSSYNNWKYEPSFYINPDKL